ncbi:MAG: hypothetical protein K2X27_18600 [Candidatus Obscuribacterales bacterium]|nr:hypothetical protein [Candidatus Obscuribacterales bacterium]
MSSRTLRLLISVCLVFGVFIYVLSSQIDSITPRKMANEGLPGGPLPGLTRWQQLRFEEGRLLFENEFALADGLGPAYNAKSCKTCHGGKGTSGGAGFSPLQTIDLVAKRQPKSRFPATQKASDIFSKTEAADLDYFLKSGGPVVLRNSITDDAGLKLPPGCKYESLKAKPSDAEFVSKRYAPQLYGLGFINSISDGALSYWQNRQAQPGGAGGKTAQLKAVSAVLQSTGRFGSKAQEATLIQYIARDLCGQIGITNPLNKGNSASSVIPDCLKNLLPADPNDDGSKLSKINFYLSLLAPPPRAVMSPAARRGEQRFQTIGCASCHMPAMQTPEKVYLINPDCPLSEVLSGTAEDARSSSLADEKPKFVEVKALEDKQMQAYSDLLLHDLGPGLADGYAEGAAGGSQWRSAPLWGLRYRRYYLHDGRAASLSAAIRLHGGQAAASAKAFAALSEVEKRELLAFLESL